MTDDRIIDIFQQHGQFVTGKDYALIRAIAEAVSPRFTWAGLSIEERNDCLVDADPCECLAGPEAEELMRCIEAKLKEKNT